LSQAQRIAHLGYWDRDLKTGKVHWSDEVYRIFGLGPGTFKETYDEFLSFIHPDDRQKIFEKKNSLDVPDKLEAEYRVIRPDGSQRVVLDRAEIINGPDGKKPAYLMGTVLDITERKQMEDTLRKARDELEIRVKERTSELERQANLLELAHDAIIVRDMEDRIVFWNHGAEDMYGWNKKEALGFIISGLLETKFPVPREDVMKTLIDTGRWEGELEHVTRDRRIITTHSRQALQRDDEGRPAGIMEINTDITAARQVEDQLRHSQKMQAIGTLAGGIAHDFNNILASILGFTEMAIDDAADRPDVQKYLHNVLRSALRARDLVKQILAFSRKTDYTRSPISIIPVIEETIQMLRASIPANIEINLSISTAADVVVAAPVEIQQILMNLVTNASLAMEERGGVMEISLADVDLATDSSYTPEEYLELMVRDTGEGMTPEVMKRVFDPFFTTRDPDRGTGMGLAVVYGIVKDLEGLITVESKPGKGSIFRVKLPRGVRGPEETHPEITVSPAAREWILFVDDEELLVELGRSMLGRLGYNVVALTNPVEALEIFSSDPSKFDLIITDQAMPGMTGTELAGRILSIRDDIPIILCTGHSEVISSETAKQFGIASFLMKPLSRKELARAIRAVTEKKSNIV
ncbi:MAG: PAS domain-containing protein, partial [Syntrophorhabdus sp.]